MIPSTGPQSYCGDVNVSLQNNRSFQAIENPQRNTNREAAQQDTIQSIQNGCENCTCGLGQLVLGAFLGFHAILSESACYLFSGIVILSEGVGKFFAGLYQAVSAVCCKRTDEN
ncbi:MAG: hypothetical protein Tsb0015_15670 [Simkaniaceae bacterium]